MTKPTEAALESGRSDALPLSKMQEGLIDAIKCHKGGVRHSALNAVRCLRRAWLIAELDPEMAYFRAITAEEEAATALIKALTIRKYPGARSLNPRRHADKAGWTVLIQTLGRLFAETGWPQPKLQLQKEAKPPRIDVHIPSEGMGLPPGYHITPDEPLNLVIHEGENDAPPIATLGAKRKIHGGRGLARRQPPRPSHRSGGPADQAGVGLRFRRGVQHADRSLQTETVARGVEMQWQRLSMRGAGRLRRCEGRTRWPWVDVSSASDGSVPHHQTALIPGQAGRATSPRVQAHRRS